MVSLLTRCPWCVVYQVLQYSITSLRHILNIIEGTAEQNFGVVTPPLYLEQKTVANVVHTPLPFNALMF